MIKRDEDDKKISDVNEAMGKLIDSIGVLDGDKPYRVNITRDGIRWWNK